MKKIISLILSAVMALTFLTGFQETAETLSVSRQDYAQMLQKAEQGTESSVKLSELKVPERFTGDWDGMDGCVIVRADAEIQLPDVGKIPAGVIGRRKFTQEDADTLMQVLLRGNTLYEDLGMTKQQALDRLERYYAMQRGEIPLEGDSLTYENLAETIERWEDYARSAPNGDERIPASTVFSAEGPAESIRGWAEVDGKIFHLFIQNMDDYWDKVIVCEEGAGDLNSSWAQPVSSLPEDTLSEPLTVDFPPKDAIRQGDALMAELGLENVVCDTVYPVYFANSDPFIVFESEEDASMAEEEWQKRIFTTGYELQYVRCVNGFPISYTPIDGTARPEDDSTTAAWMVEKITLDYTEDGLICFQWFSPHTEPVLMVEDAQLMPFEQIEEIFAKMIMVKNSDVLFVNERNGFTTTRNLQINKVKLSLMRIKAKGTSDEGLLIPVWDFWGTNKRTYDGWDNYGVDIDNGEEILLTINAVDGSLIDRELGY